MFSNDQRRRCSVLVLLALGLLVSLQPSPAYAQTERPRKLRSKDAYAALRKFNAAERDLIKKRNEKRKTLTEFFEDARKGLRKQLTVDLNTSVDAETKSGNLDEALKVRNAIKYFEKLDLKRSDAEAEKERARLAAANKRLLVRAANLKARLGLKSPKKVNAPITNTDNSSEPAAKLPQTQDSIFPAMPLDSGVNSNEQ